jgi:hypothetical protein
MRGDENDHRQTLRSRAFEELGHDAEAIHLGHLHIQEKDLYRPSGRLRLAYHPHRLRPPAAAAGQIDTLIATQ